jgi:hypothetical protein
MATTAWSQQMTFQLSPAAIAALNVVVWGLGRLKLWTATLALSATSRCQGFENARSSYSATPSSGIPRHLRPSLASTLTKTPASR